MPDDTAGPLDVPALTAVLDGRHGEVRDRTRAELAARAELLADVADLPRDAYRERVRELVCALAKGGSTGLGFPEKYGGGGDLGGSIAAFETTGMGDLSVLVKIGVQFGLCGGAILQLGSQRHHDAYLPGLIRAEVMGCFAMTETGHGSNVQALGTTATYDADSDEFVIETPDDSARKDYIGNAAQHAHLAVVFAQLHVGDDSHGVHALVVPLRAQDGSVLPGVRIEDDGPKIGLNGVDNGRIWFDRVRVPRDALLDRYATVDAEGTYRSPIENPDRRFFTMLGTLVQGRVCVGGAGLSAAKVALELAIRYALQRRQFGPPGTDTELLLLDYGMHQRRLFPLLARSYALNAAQAVLSDQLDDLLSGPVRGDGDTALPEAGSELEHRRRALESRAAGTKALATWHASRTIQECREACGGAGYLTANRLGALRADTDVFTTFEGDNHVLLQLVAKGLLTDYSSEFGDLDQLGMVRFVASLAVDTVLERTAVHKLVERIRDVLPGGEDRWDQEAELRDPEYQLAMFRWREDHRLANVARRLKRGIDRGDEPTEVFSIAQDHVISLAWAHVERLTLEAFVELVRGVPEGAERRVLASLCDLFALSTIEADRGWWMEHGRLSAPRAKAITREIGTLCREVRPVALELVEAFGIPAELRRVEMLPND